MGQLIKQRDELENRLEEGHIALEDRNFKKALEIYLPLANEGNRAAIYSVGYIYAAGFSGEIAEKEAINWFRKLDRNTDTCPGVKQSAIIAFQLSQKFLSYDLDRAKRWLKISEDEGFDPKTCKI